jgi:Cu+-exporting ATPase
MKPMSVHLAIHGMTCASCVSHVEQALLAVTGVSSVSVNLATEKAEIELTSSPTPEIITALVRAVVAAGYQASPLDEDVFGRHDSRQRQEEKTAMNLFLWSAAFTLPQILGMALAHEFFPGWLMVVLGSLVQWGPGLRFHGPALKGLRHNSTSMDLLISLGSTAAWGLSLVLWLQGSMDLYFEAGSSIITLVLLGKALENRARHRAADAIGRLQALHPETARLIDPGRPRRFNRPIASRFLLPGDRVLVNAGERIPADGKVLEGMSEVDESLMTGESLPITKEVGSLVTGGTLNGAGPLVVEVASSAQEGTLARIIRVVEKAQASKPPIARQADRISAVFIPIVLLISVITLLITFFVTGSWQTSLLHAVSVMVIACPCALGLATPVSIVAGTGVAAQKGILIRDAAALETCHSLKGVAFDKTGTLTEGTPRVTAFEAIGVEQAAALELAAGLQVGSEHGLARALQQLAEEKGISPAAVEQITTLPGIGIKGSLGERALVMEKHQSIAQNHPDWLASPIGQNAQSRIELGESLSWLYEIQGETIKPLAWFSFGDSLKANARETIQRLKAMGLSTALISGDHPQAVARVAQELEVDRWFGGVLPQEKQKVVEELHQQWGTIAMVGDGVNDAPALASAQVGIAMGSGTAVAVETAGIVLLRNDPLAVVEAMEISRRTWNTLRQNLFWALIYNLLGIPLAAFGLLSPVIAGSAMAMSSISVVSNALLLRRRV